MKPFNINPYKEPVYSDEIEDEFEACVYCGDMWTSRKDVYGCCGEVHHETIYVIGGDYYRKEELFKIKEGSRPLTENELYEKEMERQADEMRLGE